MEFPLDEETMRSFLGMINYLNRYSVHSHFRLQTTSQGRYITRTSID